MDFQFKMWNVQVQPHFDATKMDRMTVDPFFLFWISKGDLTRLANAKFHGNLIAGYILNEFKWIFNIRPLVALAVFPDLVFKLLESF